MAIHRANIVYKYSVDMSSTIKNDTIVQAVSHQITGDLPDGDIVILNLKDGVYFGLNDVGRRIWCLIQEPLIVSEILKVLLDEYNVDPEECSREVIRLLIELQDHDLLLLRQEYVSA